MFHIMFLVISKNLQHITAGMYYANSFSNFLQEIDCNMDDDFQFGLLFTFYVAPIQWIQPERKV